RGDPHLSSGPRLRARGEKALCPRRGYRKGQRMNIAFVKTSARNFTPTLRRILHRRGEGERQVLARVEEILRSVRETGDRALCRYARLFDKVQLDRVGIEVPRSEINKAMAAVPGADLRVMRAAAERIKRFHRRQLEKSWSYRDSVGLILGQ